MRNIALHMLILFILYYNCVFEMKVEFAKTLESVEFFVCSWGI